MHKQIKIVIADDHPVVIDGFRVMLGSQEEIAIIGTAFNGRELVSIVNELRPDLVFTDIKMPLMDGIEATRMIREMDTDIGVIAFTMHNDDHSILDMLDAGAAGYILKDASAKEIIDAARAVYAGGHYFSSATSLRLSKMMADKRKLSTAANTHADLSEKEIQIIRLMCEGYGTKEIAGKTDLSVNTIESYRKTIFKKTRVQNLAGVVVYAIRNGIFNP